MGFARFQPNIAVPGQNIVYIEETVVLRNAHTQRFLTRLQGVVYAWCMNHGCEFNTIRPTSWRKAINLSTGKFISYSDSEHIINDKKAKRGGIF